MKRLIVVRRLILGCDCDYFPRCNLVKSDPVIVNKKIFSIQSSSNFAHADQVARLEMAARHVNTWIRLLVSAESSKSLFSFMF